MRCLRLVVSLVKEAVSNYSDVITCKAWFWAPEHGVRNSNINFICYSALCKTSVIVIDSCDIPGIIGSNALYFMDITVDITIDITIDIAIDMTIFDRQGMVNSCPPHLDFAVNFP